MTVRAVDGYVILRVKGKYRDIGEGMKEEVCQCFHRYGESSPDCEWLFRPHWHRQVFCPACQPIADRARKKQWIHNHRHPQVPLETLQDATEAGWTACWIDRVCTCCGNKGVPTFNRFLCYYCWKGYAGIDEHTLLYQIEKQIDKNAMTKRRVEQQEPNGEVKVYSSKDYTQEQLQEILSGKNSC